jgi:UTP-glucose-1-phosphate uridylyltransferase
MDPVGPSGEFILDYSVYDALRAGANRVVFIVRRDIEDAFREVLGNRIGKQVPVEYVRQELSDIPAPFTVPPYRKKPWGTGHAVLVCADTLRGPFVAANADDFYGRETYEMLFRFLRETEADEERYAMPGFILRNTVSEHGSVARGVCRVSPQGRLEGITERTDIERVGQGYRCTGQTLTGEEAVSMNIWALKPSIFGHLRREFRGFLEHRGRDPKAEFFLPTVVNALIAEGRAAVDVLQTPCAWFGATYPQDKPRVVESIRRLIAAGDYPSRLWK